MASLIMAFGPRQGESFWLGDRVNIIGSGTWASLRIMDRSVSQEHLTIRRDPTTGLFVASPMDPNNPVYVNGRQITTDRRLFEEDHILIGDTVLEFTEKDRGHFEKGRDPTPVGTEQGSVSKAQDGAEPEDEGLKEVCGWRAVWDATGMTFERFTEPLLASDLTGLL